jgi:DNA polymerase III epsilon subunit-like protein
MDKNTILIFDTETTGLPKNWKAPLTDLENWPRLVQFASQTYDRTGRLLRQYTAIVKPDGFEVPAKASEIHGITHERALAEGCRLQDVLQVFHEDVTCADILVGHNIEYDKNIMGSELIRAKFPAINPPRRKICTMKESVQLCALPRYKWPKLIELHQKLFACDFEGAHNAMHDVAATAKCFWKLVQRGIIKI